MWVSWADTIALMRLRVSCVSATKAETLILREDFIPLRWEVIEKNHDGGDGQTDCHVSYHILGELTSNRIENLFHGRLLMLDDDDGKHVSSPLGAAKLLRAVGRLVLGALIAHLGRLGGRLPT